MKGPQNNLAIYYVIITLAYVVWRAVIFFQR